MKTFVVIHKGLWPDPECSTVVAPDAGSALDRLEEKLMEDGIWGEDGEEKKLAHVVELDTTTPQVVTARDLPDDVDVIG